MVSVVIETGVARDGVGAFAQVLAQGAGGGLHCTADCGSSRAAILRARQWAKRAGHVVGYVNGRRVPT
ncbi:MAG TPA: hypothetical protein VMY35_10425 [Phycisphaerae bacterium]|nr:hypothetical protein [Phycisphaerae bacterium]